MSNFKQPGILSRLTCLLLGHKYLYDGAIKSRTTPTLQNFIYKEDAEASTVVGLCFCPRCYIFTGIHFTEKKQPIAAPEIIEPLIAKAKKAKPKAKPVVKKFKK